MCFYKDDFKTIALQDKIKRRDYLKSIYTMYDFEFHTWFNNKKIIFKKEHDIIDFYKISTNTIAQLIKNPDYTPKLKKYRFIKEGNMRIEKVIL